MAADNVNLNPGSGGSTLRTLADAAGNEWPVGVATYATTILGGANVLQVVTPTAGLPVAQQGAWAVTCNIGAAGALALDTSVSGLLVAQGSATAGEKGPLVQGAVSNAAPSYTSGQTSPLSVDTSGNVRVLATPNYAAVQQAVLTATPLYAKITASASGASTIVAAVPGKSIVITRWSLSANGTVNVNWQSHTTTATATGLHYMTQFGTAGGAFCPQGIFATAPGEALDLNLSASVAVGGELTYVVV